MTLVLVVNIVLCAVVFTVIMAVASWAIRGSHREGRPLTVASRKRWVRPTITLHRPVHSHSGTRTRPFEAGFDA